MNCLAFCYPELNRAGDPSKAWQDWSSDNPFFYALHISPDTKYLAVGEAKDAGPTGITIRSSRFLADDPHDLLLFVDRCAAVLASIRSASQGQAAVPTASEVAQHGKCPVCAQSLSGKVRRCRKCHTNHHPECWDYFGRCAIYACAGRTGVTRKVADGDATGKPALPG